MPTILDAESSYMNGNARAQEWRDKFIEKWFGPIEEARLMAWWQAQTPQMHAAMKAIDPVAYAEVEKKVKELQERSKRNARAR